MQEYSKESIQSKLDKISFAPSGIRMNDSGKASFIVIEKNGNLFIQCSFWRPDTRTGLDAQGFGRPYYIDPKSSETAIIMTAWMAFKQIIEHEAMECFLYKDVRLFDPHKNLQQLAYPQEIAD